MPVTVLMVLLNPIWLRTESSEQLIVRGQPNFNPLMQSALKGYKNTAVAWLPDMEYANTIGKLCIDLLLALHEQFLLQKRSADSQKHFWSCNECRPCAYSLHRRRQHMRCLLCNLQT